MRGRIGMLGMQYTVYIQVPKQGSGHRMATLNIKGRSVIQNVGKSNRNGAWFPEPDTSYSWFNPELGSVGFLDSSFICLGFLQVPRFPPKAGQCR